MKKFPKKIRYVIVGLAVMGVFGSAIQVSAIWNYKPHDMKYEVVSFTLISTPGVCASGIIGLNITSFSGASSYSILRGNASGGPYPVTVSSGSTNLSYTDNSNLTPGNNYYYSAQALNGSGTVLATSNESTAKAPRATCGPYTLTIGIINVGTGTGTVGGAGSYAAGTIASATATAGTNSTFSGWSGDCGGTTSPLSVTMDRDKSCFATFRGSGSGGMSGSLAAAPNPCKIQLNQNRCATTLSWDVNNPEISDGTAVTSSTNNDGNTSSNFVISPPVSSGTKDSGTKSNVSVPFPNRTFFLYNNSQRLDMKVVAAECDTNLVWQPSSKKCVQSSQFSPYIISFNSTPGCIDDKLVTAGDVGTSTQAIDFYWTGSADSCTSPQPNSLFSGSRTGILSGSDHILKDIPLSSFQPTTYTIQCERNKQFASKQYTLDYCSNLHIKPIIVEPNDRR